MKGFYSLDCCDSKRIARHMTEIPLGSSSLSRLPFLLCLSQTGIFLVRHHLTVFPSLMISILGSMVKHERCWQQYLLGNMCLYALCLESMGSWLGCQCCQPWGVTVSLQSYICKEGYRHIMTETQSFKEVPALHILNNFRCYFPLHLIVGGEAGKLHIFSGFSWGSTIVFFWLIFKGEGGFVRYILPCLQVLVSGVAGWLVLDPHQEHHHQ